MEAAVSITRLDLTAWELRKAASGEKNSAAARRILALALVLDGVDRKTAAETCGWRDGERGHAIRRASGERGQAIRRARVGLGPIRVAAAQRGPLRHTL